MEYFINNPCGKITGDCVIRAISKATGASWYQIYDDLCALGRDMCVWGNDNSVWGEYLLRIGFHRRAIPDTCPNCYTIADFTEEHPQGVYIIATGSHAVCVIDGIIYDSWDSSHEIPIYYFYRRD